MALRRNNITGYAAPDGPLCAEVRVGKGKPVPLDLATPAALKKQLASELARWGPVIKAAGVKGN